MKIEVVSTVPQSTTHHAVFSRRHRSIFTAAPYQVLPLADCTQSLPSTSSLSDCAIECLGLSTDERSLGVATNALLKVVDVATAREVRNLAGHTLPITTLAASRFSVYDWFSGSSDSTWAQWDTRVHPSRILAARAAGIVRSVALSPVDRLIAIGTDNTIQLFDTRNRQYIQQYNFPGHKLEFNPSEVLLSSVGSDRIVRFFCLESFQMISQSDPFLDDIQGSVFDTHLMIASTSDSIHLLTWEPCDVLTTVPLKNVEKVVDVSVNNGIELDFICVGETTERLELRTYSIEELLQYSPSHDLSGSIYEEEEEDEEEEVNALVIEKAEQKQEHAMGSTSVSRPNSAMSSNKASSVSPSESSSSPPFPPKMGIKTRSQSVKCRTESKLPQPSVKPPLKSTTRNPAASTRRVGHTRPSPSLSEMPTSLRGSSQSLMSENGMKKRSQSTQRSNDSITITYMGRPRTPSESEYSKNARKPATGVKKSANTVKPQKAESIWTKGLLVKLSTLATHAKNSNNTLKQMRRAVRDKGVTALGSSEVREDNRLSLKAMEIINMRNEWSLNLCHLYLPLINDGIVSVEDSRRRVCMTSLELIAEQMIPRIVKFANTTSRIGVDVAAEERSAKAKDCLKTLRNLCKRRSWYYKQLDQDTTAQLDAVMEKLKNL